MQEVKELRKICQQVINTYPDKFNNYRLGKTKLIGFFTAEAMRQVKGKVESSEIFYIMIELLDK